MSYAKLLKPHAKSPDDADIAGFEDTPSLCPTCRWFKAGALTCEAFPEGIPSIILMGAWDHHYTYRSEDLTYEPSLNLSIKTFKKEAEKRIPAGQHGGGQFTSNNFSAEDFAKKGAGDYAPKQIVELLKAGHKLAQQVLSPEEYAEFSKKFVEAENDRAAGKETSKLFTKDGIYTKERQAVHTKIIADHLKNMANFKPKEGEKPLFVMAGGRGGAGKSQFDEEHAREYDSNKCLVVDSDKIKEALPNYNPEKAQLFHKEANHIVDTLLRLARHRKLNVVYDATLNRDDTNLMRTFNNKGFDTKAVFMHVNPRESAGRALHRWLNKAKFATEGRGRLVPPQVVLGMTQNEANFDKVKQHAKSWAFYRNDSPVRGVKASKVASGKGALAKEDLSFVALLTNGL